MEDRVPRAFAAMAASLLAACSTTPDALSRGHVGENLMERRVTFTATRFTRPYIEVSPDGQSMYFDVLGEIYRAPISGGRAVRVALGDGWKTQPTLSRDGGWIAFTRDHAEAPGIWVQSTTSSERFMALSSDGVGIGPVEALDEAIYYPHDGVQLERNLQTGSFERIGTKLPGKNGQVRKSRDGRRIGYAAVHGDRTVLIVHQAATGKDLLTGCELDPSNDNDRVATYAFIPAQDAVLLSRNGSFVRCGFDGAEREIPVTAEVDIALAPMLLPRTDRVRRTQIRHPSITARGSELAFTARGRVWRAALGGSPEPLLPERGESLMPAYAPDGKSIAYVYQEDGVASLRLLDIESGKVRILASSVDRTYANPAWNPDGSLLAFVDVDQRNRGADGDVIRYLSLRDGSIGDFGRTTPTPNQTHLYQRISWSPDGEGIYYTREPWPESGGRLDAIELIHHPIGGEPEVLLTMQLAIQAAVVSPSGRYVALQDRLGIAILPLPHPSDVPVHVRHVSLMEARRLPRIRVNGPDYVWWAADDQLLWSVQDEVFVSREWKFGRMVPTERVARIILPAQEQRPAERKVYSGARIVTMTERGVIENGAIATAGSTIEYVGPAHGVPVQFEDAEVVPLSGKTVIPGLIDVHAHRSFYLDDLATLSSHEFLAEVAYGVTTVFDPQVSTIKSAYLTDLSRDDTFPGPTFYGSGSGILGDIHNGAHALIESPDDAIGYVERQAKAGAPLVKAYWRPSRQDRQWLVQAARGMGVGIASDERRTMPVQLGSVQDGYTAVEHTLMLQPAPAKSDVIRFMKDSHVSITPTVAIRGHVEEFLARRTKPDMRASCLVRDPEARTSPQALRERSQDDLTDINVVSRNALRESAEMLNAGVRVSIGGHGKPAGLITHWEMWALALGGATPMNVLKAATVNGAYKLGMQDRIGALAEGMDADFVILDANPLDDIYNTLEIDRVVRRGRVVQWPEGSRLPLSWPGDVDWEACKAWNLGVPR